MSKVQSIPFKEFMQGDHNKTKNRSDKRKLIINTCIVTSIIIITPFDIAEASTGNIDAGAKIIYAKLLSVGKWVIIIKGGIDTINNAVQGNLDMAKKSFLSYLMVYVVLQGLPWAMDEIDGVFTDF